MMDRKYVAAIAVVAAAGAGMIAFATNNVSAAEAHRAALTTVPVEGVQVAQAAGNATAGATAFIRCRVCHTVERGEPNRVGPNLFGVVGRKAATVAGFNYSEPMKASNITWDDAALNRYIQDPPGTVPGNKMQLAKGAINAQGAADIIAFLKTKM
jgi:cytochrome c